jgi:1,4-alpha-glucan branching enzyme
MTVQWRPAYAFALVASLMAAPLAMRALPTSPETAASKQVFVQFRLDAPSAQNVHLAGDFTNWKATVSLQRSASGVWTVLVPLQPGVHSYSFVINGQEWVTDPTAPTVSDGFGGKNSQLAVLTPEAGRAM